MKFTRRRRPSILLCALRDDEHARGLGHSLGGNETEAVRLVAARKGLSRACASR
jgi:hypothetical protein